MSNLTAGPAHRVQSAVVEYGYPRGHLGHLSAEEEEAFKNFKLLCEEKGIYKPGSKDDSATHDDATLLRFLRARRFVVGEAYKQFEDTEKWRKANELDKLYATIDLDHYEETRRLYPQWTGRRDRRGIPLYVFEVKHLNSKRMAAYEKLSKETYTKAHTDGKTSPKMLRLFAGYENLTHFTMPLCTALKDRDNASTPITQSNNIVDISGVGLKQFWNLRAHMQDASTLATAHYPETLDRIFIIGAPAFFPTVWGWIKKWFDPITTSKIFIISSQDMKKTLESFIDPANIPKKYGGQLEFQFGDMPVLDPALKEVLTWEGNHTDFPAGPIYWIDNQGRGDGGSGTGEMQAIAIGSSNKEERREHVCTLMKAPVVSNSGINGHAVEGKGNGKAKDDASDNLGEIGALGAAVAAAPVDVAAAPEKSKGEVLQDATSALGSENKAVEEGKLVPASRPEPVSFVTASEHLETLNLNGNAGNVGPSKGPHSSTTANLLDPNVSHGVPWDEKTSEADKSAAAAEGRVEEANKAQPPAEVANEQVPNQSLGDKLKQKIGV